MYYIKQNEGAGVNVNRLLSRRTAAFIPLMILAAVMAVIFLPKLSRQSTRTIIKDSCSASETLSFYTDANDIIAEQRQKLHPFDMISYAGFGDDGSFIIEIRRAPSVQIIDGEAVKDVRAVIGETVAALLSREGVKIGEYDVVTPGVDTVLTEDAQINIERAVPVTIDADKNTLRTFAAKLTVSELLDREGLSLGEHDTVNYDRNEIVAKDMFIIVHRVAFEETVSERELPYDIVTKDDPLCPMGFEQVISEGENGRETTTTLHKYIDGDEVSSQITGVKIVPPKDKVILCGSAFAEPISRREGDYSLKDGLPTEYEYVISGKATAYVAPEGSGTYSGRPLVRGSVAVDPDIIPFGSELYIVSKDRTHVYGYAIASDTGYLTQANVLVDVFMGTAEDNFDDVCWWGAQECDVYVLRTGDNSVSWR